MPMADNSAPIVVGMSVTNSATRDYHRDRAAGIGHIARDRGCGENEDDGQANQQDIERNLVWRFLSFGAFDQPDHAIEEGRARCGCDAHAYPIGQHLRAAGDGRAVTTRLADHRCRFAGNRRLVDRSHAYDHLAVRRNKIAGLDQNKVANLKAGTRHQPIVLLIACAGNELGLGFGALTAQRVGLCLTPTLGDGFREVGEQHGEPQPQDNLKLKADMPAAGHQIANQDHRRERRDDFEHEHDRILHQRSRIELDEGRADRR